MDSLIDQVLNTILHSAIWRAMWHVPLPALIGIAVVAFLLLAYRRTRRTRSNKRKRGYKYRSKY